MTAAHWSVGAGATDTGPRARNEDSFLSAGAVHLVADGMGGHVGGAAASAAAIEAFRELSSRTVVTPADVADAMAAAQAAVLDVGRRAGAESGTTLTGAVAVEHEGEPWWMVVNVGDSRTYQLEGTHVHQITVDHSHVQQLVDAGRITPEQAMHHPDRNIITRALGDGVAAFDAWLVPVAPGSRLIVASDGLTGAVPDELIGSVAGLADSDEEAAERLVEAALRHGTGDNVTVVVAHAPATTTPLDADPGPWPLWPLLDGEDDTTGVAARREPQE
ncbi:PP2C family serine/threonine-protein phosphatase [Demequina sp. NBRC 110057]|uniref:PP2C family protein-serine/threonine phosphatase n=1 Tax=Demequina sp. NBRC 110057 TaxID=1570346 RepID=UPI000A0614F3|nr:protein phosphatase 2C domain-containing protein [Demequina sp. NBRC 110057]